MLTSWPIAIGHAELHFQHHTNHHAQLSHIAQHGAIALRNGLVAEKGQFSAMA